MCCEAGFEAIDYSMYEGDGAVFGRGGSLLLKEMRRVADSYGVSFNQTHAPFSRFRLGIENDGYNRELFDKIRRSIDFTAALGAPRVVIHPAFICRNLTADERFGMNMDFYLTLLPYAKQVGVEIAIENMWGRHRDDNQKIIKNVCSDAEELIRYVDGVGDPSVTACLDVGHAVLVGESPDAMARALGTRLSSVHLHDNGFYYDDHTLPFMGKVNFVSFANALSEISYRGDITLESNSFMDRMPDGLVPAALVFSAKTAAFIREMVTEFTQSKSGDTKY
jgi:sugar phosphate isomerase/epimerase